MADILLHHYPESPFSEKIRALLAAKKLPWKSVRIPMIMPKPDVIALTGGYRKTPILQIGADVYCDSARIARRLDELGPTPRLVPDSCAAATESLARWADSSLFWVAVTLRFLPAPGQQPFLPSADAMRAFAADRAAFRKGSTVRPIPPDEARATLAVLARELEAQLADGRSYAFGLEPTSADYSLYHPLWFLRGNAVLDGVLAKHEHVRGWFERMHALRLDPLLEVSGEEAVAIAKSSRPQALAPQSDAEGIAAGERVEVLPTDYGLDPTAGELVVCTRDEIAVRRTDPRAGELLVHFPRLGYTLRRPAQD